jgi:hypothetical protein
MSVFVIYIVQLVFLALIVLCSGVVGYVTGGDDPNKEKVGTHALASVIVFAGALILLEFAK